MYAKNQTINIKQCETKVRARAPKISYESEGLTLSIEAVTFKENKPTDYNRYYDGWVGWVGAANPFYTVALVRGETKETFDFTDSINAFVTGDLATGREIFHCLMDDYTVFLNVADFDEFQGTQNLMDELGYEKIIEAHDIYKALHANYLKLVKLGITEEYAYQWLNDNNDI